MHSEKSLELATSASDPKRTLGRTEKKRRQGAFFITRILEAGSGIEPLCAALQAVDDAIDQ